MGWRMNNNKRVLLLTLNKARVIIYSSYEYTLWSVVAIASVLFSIILILFYVLFVKRLIFFNTPSLLTFRALLYNNWPFKQGRTSWTNFKSL
jgi:hypothetical protein